MLKAENVSKHFIIHHSLFSRIRHSDHIIKAVDGVSLYLRKGDLIGIIGESGSGKTTLAKTIAGLYRPSRGSVYYHNEDILSLGKEKYRKFRREVQMIFQDSDSTLDPRMTAKALLEEPLRIQHMSGSRERKQHIDRVMSQVRLPESLLCRYPSELSGGQRQRLAIARALLLEPQIIIADEPLAGLDNIISVQILKLLLEIKEELGLGYLLVSHDLELVSSVCNHIAVIYRGKIVEYIDGGRFQTAAVHPYTLFLRDGAGLRVPAAGFNHQPAGVHIQPRQFGGCSYEEYCPHRTAVCAQSSPELKALSPEHLVRCHFVRPGRGEQEETGPEPAGR